MSIITTTSQQTYIRDSFGYNDTTKVVTLTRGGKTISIQLPDDNAWEVAHEINRFVDHCVQVGRVEIVEKIKSQINYKL